MFLRLRLHFVEIVELVGLTYSAVNYVECGNYAIIHAHN